MSSQSETRPCAFLVDPARRKLCGAPVPRSEWPADPSWPTMCRDHLDTYRPKLVADREPRRAMR